jgi:hypothetical protein
MDGNFPDTNLSIPVDGNFSGVFRSGSGVRYCLREQVFLFSSSGPDGTKVTVPEKKPAARKFPVTDRLFPVS